MLDIFMRNVKWRFHHKFTIIITILQPILWLLLYAGTAGSAMKNLGIDNYNAYILPGITVLVSFSASSSSGIINYLTKKEGSFKRILISPIDRKSIVFGHILESSLTALFEAVILFAIGIIFFSVRINSGIAGALWITGLLFLNSMLISAFSYFISLCLPNEVVYETFMNAVVLPIFFLSSALFPTEELTGIVKVLVSINPFTHLINAVRSTMFMNKLTMSNAFFVLLLFSVGFVLMYTLSIVRLNSETQRV